MKIKELYDKKIDRRINPAVVVSEMDEYFINQEIEEYVFTSGVTKNVYNFLDAIANKKEGKTGVWISGYYGSGKSHFIKYLFYSLNKKYREKAFANFKESVKEIDPLEEPNLGSVTSLHKKLDKLDIEEIIFNIDAVSDNDNEKDRITRVFLNQLNTFRGYNDSNIALALYLEKPLNEKGVYQKFKDEIKIIFNEDWDGNQTRFSKRYLAKVIDIAKQFDENIDVDTLKKSISNKSQDYTIDFLIEEFQDFLKSKPDNYRLIFLLDEVSQYIGNNTSLLLNLQTIVEEVGSKLGTKVWIVCTAQQNLQTLVDNTGNSTNEFGKILGRFETMISLESQDAAFITKKRVLDKNSTGFGELNEFYKNNKGAVENQFVFDHDLYENYNSKKEFILTYPFIPYQFRLISDVFESFSNVGFVGEGVKNTERAILGITHFTAKLCKDEGVGYFVPFDLFFNEQLEKNLAHHARGILDRAYNISEVKENKFYRRVVNTLFMISNLGESQSVNFPATVENIAILLMDSVDTQKQEMQQKVLEVLDILVLKNIIQTSEGKYRFLKEDEIEVANLIMNTTVNADSRLDLINKNIVQKVIKSLSGMGTVQFGNKNFRIAISLDDKVINSSGDFNLKFAFYDNTDLDSLAHATASKDIIIGINQWFATDEDIKAKVLDYVRTQKYIGDNSSNATGTRIDTLKGFRESNETLLSEIKIRFSNKFLQTAIISNNQVIPAEDLSGANPAARFDSMIAKHMESVYHKNSLSLAYATSNQALMSNAKSKQQQLIKELDPAEEELNNKLNIYGDGYTVGDVVKNFEKNPYGWKDISTLDILLRLAKKGQRRFEMNNEEIDLVSFADKAVNSRNRDTITIHREKEHSQDEINSFINLVNNEIFAENIIAQSHDYKETIEIFRNQLKPKLEKLNHYKEDYYAVPFAKHLIEFHKTLASIYNTRNIEQVPTLVADKKDYLKQARDICMQIEEFIESNFSAYDSIKKFIEQNKSNFSSLEDDLQIKADNIIDYLKNDDQPWDKFPQMKKAHKELNRAIKQSLETLKLEVKETYEKIFEEIETKKKDLGIDDGSITSSSYHYIQRIDGEKSLERLDIYKLKANDFKADNFKILDEEKGKMIAAETGETYLKPKDVLLSDQIYPTEIKSADELDKFIDKLRTKLMVKLSKDKKIFIK